VAKNVKTPNDRDQRPGPHGQGNYERYLETAERDATAPLPYDDWKQWFLETFGVSVVKSA